MNRLERIMVAVDFSAASRTALLRADALARRAGATLGVVHVVDRDAVWELADSTDDAEQDVERELLAGSRAQLERFLRRADLDPAAVDAQVVVGSPFVSIQQVAARRRADLVLLGMNGWTHPLRGAGAVSTKAVRKLPAKVMLVPADAPPRYTRVVACVDFSSAARRALAQAAHLARIEGVVLSVLHVFRPLSLDLLEPQASPQRRADLGRSHRVAVGRRLEQFLLSSAAELEGLSVRSELLEHPTAAEGILSYAPRATDVVVMGTRGRTPQAGQLLGMTTERVLRDAGCALLAVKPDEAPSWQVVPAEDPRDASRLAARPA